MTSAARCLAIVFLVFTVYTYHAEAVHTHVVCYPNSTVTLVNPIPDTLLYGAAIDSDSVCNLTFSNNFTMVTVTECSKSENIVVQLTEIEHMNGVIGGAGRVIINVMCQEIDEGIERNITQGLTANIAVDETVAVNTTFAKFMYMRNGTVTSPPIASAKMLETVYFTYDLQLGYVMRFLQCTAHPGRDTTSFSNTHKLIENDCTVDSNLINSFAPNKTVVVGSNTRYYTEMTMFRFWVSLYLTISCDIMLCRQDSNASCIMSTCPNTRRRRAVDEVVDEGVELMTSKTTFKVLDNPDYVFLPYLSAASDAFPRTCVLWILTGIVLHLRYV